MAEALRKRLKSRDDDHQLITCEEVDLLSRLDGQGAHAPCTSAHIFKARTRYAGMTSFDFKDRCTDDIVFWGLDLGWLDKAEACIPDSKSLEEIDYQGMGSTVFHLCYPEKFSLFDLERRVDLAKKIAAQGAHAMLFVKDDTGRRGCETVDYHLEGIGERRLADIYHSAYADKIAAVIGIPGVAHIALDYLVDGYAPKKRAAKRKREGMQRSLSDWLKPIVR